MGVFAGDSFLQPISYKRNAISPLRNIFYTQTHLFIKKKT